MASQLHARKKHVFDDDVQIEYPILSNDQKTGKRQRRRRGEDRWAALAVAVFLVLGLFLGYVLLHHQHRRVILHVMRNPWAHGSAVFRRKRHGFHHHFYSGPPRFVTVVSKYFLCCVAWHFVFVLGVFTIIVFYILCCSAIGCEPQWSRSPIRLHS